MYRLVSTVLCAALVFVAGLSAHGQGTTVFWSDAEEEVIYRGNVESGTYKSFIPSRFPVAFTVVDSSTYWADDVQEAIIRRKGSQGSFETIISNVDHVEDMAVDSAGSLLYWLNFFDDVLLRSPLEGGEVNTLVSWTGNADAVEVDPTESRIYWLLTGSNLMGIVGINQDGTGRDTVLSSLENRVEFALVAEERKLYWRLQSGIKRANLRWQPDCPGSAAIGVFQPAKIARQMAVRRPFWRADVELRLGPWSLGRTASGTAPWQTRRTGRRKYLVDRVGQPWSIEGCEGLYRLCPLVSSTAEIPPIWDNQRRS